MQRLAGTVHVSVRHQTTYCTLKAFKRHYLKEIFNLELESGSLEIPLMTRTLLNSACLIIPLPNKWDNLVTGPFQRIIRRWEGPVTVGQWVHKGLGNASHLLQWTREPRASFAARRADARWGWYPRARCCPVSDAVFAPLESENNSANSAPRGPSQLLLGA